MQQQKTLAILALTSLLFVALGGVLLRAPATQPAGLLVLGVGMGIVLHTYMRSAR